MQRIPTLIVKWFANKLGYKVVMLKAAKGITTIEGDKELLRYVDISGYFFKKETIKQKLNNLPNLPSEISDWDVTLTDGLENEPPYISDDFQIGPNGAYEHTEEDYKRKDMSKVTIEFDRIEEAEELRTALDGHKYKNLIWELDQKLRSVHKYGTALEGNREATEAEMDICEKLRDIIREMLREDNLTIE